MTAKTSIIGIPAEIFENCNCVSMVPEIVKKFVQLGYNVLVEKDAGEKAFYSNELYREAGAEIIENTNELWEKSDIILKLRPPMLNKKLKKHELDLMKENALIISYLAPTLNPQIVEKLVSNKLSGFAMELIPRISRAQPMDALSTMSSIMGYRASILAANYLGKFFPLLMTAAGTIQPASVLVIGAGVAGLQAIATCRRLGAKVEAFDTRPAVKEQIESLGAKFIEMELPEDTETKYGYAKEVSEEFIKKEMEAIGSRLPYMDVVITTALVYGRKAPLLITEEMVKLMKPGSVIIDLAADSGGNCQLTRAGKTISKYGVTIHGAIDLPSQMPLHTSWMYSRNLFNAFNNIFKPGEDDIDFDDEINKNAFVTYKGKLISEMLKQMDNFKKFME
ncbi:MAG: Re/Si-specific NAD(P)(+) transhydrogenase subunit alpha [Calditrichia bacterium]